MRARPAAALALASVALAAAILAMAASVARQSPFGRRSPAI
jgi:hypothetical protein